MKKYLLIILLCLLCEMLHAQEAAKSDYWNITVSFGFERIKLGGYESYRRDGGFDDGNYSVLSEVGNGIVSAIEIGKPVSERNTLLMGLGMSMIKYDANLISGWIAGVLKTEKVYLPTFSAQLAHRFNILTNYNLLLGLENRLVLMCSSKFNTYNLRETNLIWRTGLCLKKRISRVYKLTYQINYGIGIFDLSRNDSYNSRSNSIGLALGISKKID